MRSYSKKRPLVKAHEGAAQLCRVLGYADEAVTTRVSGCRALYLEAGPDGFIIYHGTPTAAAPYPPVVKE